MPVLKLNVNGTDLTVEAAPGQSLLSVLRDKLDLTGTKYGCGEGQCGACTVVFQGKPIRSCRIPAETATGAKILTIEGLAQKGALHPIQEAFLREEAFQCAYCTSGMIMSAYALLAANPNPTDEDIFDYMNGNVCRCGTYPRILAAIRRAAHGSSAGAEKS